MRTYRILSLLLAAVLALLPGFAQGTSEQALQEQVDALVAQIAELQQQDPTFVYDGETYHVSNGTQYANEHLKQTDDYYPFFDKLMEASLAHSDKIAELYLQEVRLLNQLAALWGYDNYMSYALKERYGIDVDVVALTDTVVESFSKSWQPLAWLAYLATEPDNQKFLDEDDFLKEAAALYGELCPDYQPLLESLINSDNLHLETTTPLLSGGSTSFRYGTFEVEIRFFDDLSFSSIVLHEFGHYLHDTYENELVVVNYPINETHSIAGTLLLADRMEAFFRERTGDTYGAYLTLRYLITSLNVLYSSMLNAMISIEVYTNPDAFEPRDIARLYLESSQALGYDAGYSPEYQMILGSQWITSTTLFQLPFYDFNYILGSINSLSLWYEQQTGGDAVTKYNKLVQTPIPDISYSEYCRQMGLPAVNDTDLYAALDTFLSEKLTALEEEVFGGE